MKLNKMLLTAAVAAAMTGCASNPETDSRLTQLDQRFDNLMNYQQAGEYAPVATEKALESLNQTRAALDEDLSDEVVDHRLYLAEKRLEILEQAITKNRAEDTVENAELARKEVVLKAKTLESERARQDAAVMEAHAVAATEQAIDATQQAAAFKAHAERETARAQSEAARAQSEAARAERLQSRISRLESKVDNLKTSHTERGVILTLGDILFELDSAELKNNTDVTLDEVAEFLKSYPERDIRVEGFTDDTGATSYNQQLSQDRADSVEEALVARGVDEDRISTIGYGEKRPLVSNDSPEHRQKNRRVEIILAPVEMAALTP